MMDHYDDKPMSKKDREFVIYDVLDGVKEVKRCRNAAPSSAARKGASHNVKNILVVDHAKCSKALKDWRRSGLPVTFIDPKKLGLHAYVGKKTKLQPHEHTDHTLAHNIQYRPKAIKCKDEIHRFINSELFDEFLEVFEQNRQLKADKAREYRHMREALEDFDF